MTEKDQLKRIENERDDAYLAGRAGMVPADGRAEASTTAVHDALVAAQWIGSGTIGTVPRPVADAWGTGVGFVENYRRTAAAMVAAEMRNALQPITAMLDDGAPEDDVLTAVARLITLAGALTTPEP